MGSFARRPDIETAARHEGSICNHHVVFAIHRSDGELCGFIRAHSSEWQVLTVFGAVISATATRSEAEQMVLDTALAVLSERWLLARPGHDEQIVCIQEASPESVTIALDYYSMPGVPTLTISRDEIDAGDVALRLP